MLIVIADSTHVANEAAFINAMFDAGMEIFHLRKPAVDAGELKDLLKKIKPEYHPQIALHRHHEIAVDYKIKRLHFSEFKRKEMNEAYFLKLQSDKFILSTSVHTTADYNILSSSFQYVFFGPVFNSISKKGYSATINENFVFKHQPNHPKVIAIGGVDTNNMKFALDMQFDGVAVLGAVWQYSETSVQQFIKLQKTWKQLGR